MLPFFGDCGVFAPNRKYKTEITVAENATTPKMSLLIKSIVRILTENPNTTRGIELVVKF